MFQTISLRMRILGGFATVLLLFVGAAFQNITRAIDTGQKIDTVLHEKLHIERLIAELSNIVEVSISQTIAAARSTDGKYEAELVADNAKKSLRATAIIDELKGKIADPMAKKRMDDMISQRAEFLEARKRVTAIKAKDGEQKTNAYIDATFKREANDYQQALNQLVARQHEIVSRYGEEIQRENQTAIRLTVGFTALATLFAVIAALLITRSVVRQVGGEPAEATRIAQRIAAGELDVDIPLRHGDQSSVLHAMMMMRDRLVGIVGEVLQGTGSIRAAASEVAKGAMELSSRTEQQAGALEETASSMEELTATVKGNGAHTVQASQLAESAQKLALDGGQAVGAVVSTMETIQSSSEQIAAIITVIESIAFQTNILALNAAVEAARAGDQGRGFAVVASEVRTLAQRSASAAKDIKQLIDKSAHEVAQGVSLVADAGQKIEAVIGSFRKVGLIMTDIAAASGEQTTGIEHVNKALAEIDTVTQHNAALVEESAAAAQAMEEQAESLAKVVAYFRLSSRQGPAARGGATQARRESHYLLEPALPAGAAA